MRPNTKMVMCVDIPMDIQKENVSAKMRTNNHSRDIENLKI